MFTARRLLLVQVALVLAILLAAAQVTSEPSKPTAATKPETVVQLGHSAAVRAVAVSPDGLWIASGGSDGSVCVWDAITGKELRRTESHSAGVNVIGFSPDGKRILTASDDGTARLWDALTGRELFSFNHGRERVVFANFMPHAVKVVTCAGRVVQIWDSLSGKSEARWQPLPWGSALAVSPNGTELLVGTLRSIDFYALTAAKLQRTIRRTRSIPYWTDSTAREIVQRVAYSPDGSTILTATAYSTRRPNESSISLWDARTGAVLRRVVAHETEICALAISPDGRRWASAANHDEAARLWDGDSGRELHRFRGHVNGASALAFFPSGRNIVTADRDGALRIWDTSSGHLVRLLPRHTGGVYGPEFHSDTSIRFSSGRDTLNRWDLTTGKVTRERIVPRTAPRNALFTTYSRDGRRALIGDRKQLRICKPASEDTSLPTGGPLTGNRGQLAWRTAELPSLLAGEFYLCAFSPDDKLVVALAGRLDLDVNRTRRSEDRPPSKRPSVERKGPGEPHGHVAARRVAVAPAYYTESRVWIWKADTGELQRTFDFPDTMVHAVRISPDGRQLLTGEWEGTARLWDLASGRELRQFADYQRGPLLFSPDGKHVLLDGQLWGAEASAAPTRLTDSNSLPSAASFARDGKQLLLGDYTGGVRILETATAKKVRVLNAHRSRIFALALSPDGRRLLTTASDGTTRLWDLANGQEICALIASRDEALVITPDNYYTASRGALASVAFRIGARAYPFEQFDLQFNRPDKVLQRIGSAPPEVIEAYHQAYRKRLGRMKFTEEMFTADFHLPSVEVETPKSYATTERMLKFKVTANDSKYPLDRLNVYVNGVPIQGSNGLSLRDRNVASWEQELEVELSTGKNAIQVSAINSKGAESLNQKFEIACEAKRGKPDLYVLSVGVSDYENQKMSLQYADKDAGDLAEFLARKMKAYGTIHVRKLLNRDAVKEKILEARTFLASAQADDQLIVFLAGHGVLDPKTFDYYYATADMDFQAPAKCGLRYDEIEGLLDGLKARKKLLLMDTCHSGEVDREELKVAGARLIENGGKITARAFRGMTDVRVRRLGVVNTGQLLEELFADLRRGTGTIVIAAAGGLHYALESPTWKNGVFTYALLQGLSGKADRNKDGRIQASELRQFVLEQVPRLTDGRQAPTVRRDNVEYDFAIE